MKIVGFHSYLPEHDGCWAYIKDKKLELDVEGEKDSLLRHSIITNAKFVKLTSKVVGLDVLALSTDVYLGTDSSIRTSTKSKYWGKDILIFHSSHERAHIMSSYGMSPFEQGQPCYALCWEGTIGRFYYIDGKLNIEGYPTVLTYPGTRYFFPFEVALNKRVVHAWDASYPGKTMALTGFATRDSKTKEYWGPIVKSLNDYDEGPIFGPFYRSTIVKYIDELRKTPINKVGVESQIYKDFSYYYSQDIFERFYEFAKTNFKEKLPLIVSGGCGLNCDWNTQWKNCDLFSDIFIPPNTDDGSIGLGMAIDAQHYYTGDAKIEWSPYAGEEFINDIEK